MPCFTLTISPSRHVSHLTFIEILGFSDDFRWLFISSWDVPARKNTVGLMETPMGFINQYLKGPFSCRFPCKKNVIHCSELFLFIFFTLHPTRYCLLAQSRGQLTQQYLSTEPTREMVQNIPWNPPEWSASMRNYWKAIGFRGPFVDTPVNF